MSARQPKNSLALLVAVAALSPGRANEPQTPAPQGRLSIAIVSPKDKSGVSIIQRAGVFQVIFKNESKEPIRLWVESCRLGHETLSFLVDQDGGQPSRMFKVARAPSDWRNRPLKTSTIPLGGTFELDLFAAIALDDARRVAEILKKDPKAAVSKYLTGTPALHEAVILDRKEIVKLLLEAGCDPDIQNDNQSSAHATALLRAAYWGRLQIAESLIKHGAKVNPKAAPALSPLHEAARMGHVDLARLLLKHGADVNAKDDNGETPLDCARAYGEASEITKLLRSHGGKGKRSKPMEDSMSQMSHEHLGFVCIFG